MNILLTLLLAGLTMVGPLAIDTYLPSFPAIARTFDASPLLVQQTLSAFLFCFAFMMLFYGTLSDSFGRRPVILWSLVLYIVASIGGAMAPSIGVLLVCRVAQGLAAGAGSVVGRAIVQDRFSGAEAQKILSHIMMVFGLAPAIAPVLGGWLQVSLGWRSVFWFLTSFGILMFIAVARAAREPAGAGPPSLPLRRDRRQLLEGAAPSPLPAVVDRGRLVVRRFRLVHRIGGLLRHQYFAPAGDLVRVAVHPADQRHGGRLGAVGQVRAPLRAAHADLGRLWLDGARCADQRGLQLLLRGRGAVGGAAAVRVFVRHRAGDAADVATGAEPLPEQ